MENIYAKNHSQFKLRETLEAIQPDHSPRMVSFSVAPMINNDLSFPRRENTLPPIHLLLLMGSFNWWEIISQIEYNLLLSKITQVRAHHHLP